MSYADAAIVLTTGDDFACAKADIVDKKCYKKKELSKILKPRPRQNVILELGMLINMLGERKILILTHKDMEYPSDLVGRFWEFIENDADINERIRYFVESISINTSYNLLSKDDYPITYDEMKFCSDMPIKSFQDEYSKLDEPWEKALFLAERIVFDSYIQNPSWWKRCLKDIKVGNYNDISLKYTLTILDNVLDYMESWQPPHKKNFTEIELICNHFEEALSVITQHKIKIAPIVLIIAYDYLGLVYNKLSMVEYLSDFAKDNLLKSINSFDMCIDFAKKYDDDTLKLWIGYALFNRARSIYEIMSKSENDEQKKYFSEWKKNMNEVISIRKKWKDSHVKFPDVIKDGLNTEYFHSIVERLLKADRDENGVIIEIGEASIDKYWELDVKNEFNQWWDNPMGIRVRLAFNVKNNWDKLNNSTSNN